MLIEHRLSRPSERESPPPCISISPQLRQHRLDASLVGQKASALDYFRRVGLFDSRLLIVPPGDHEKISEQIARCNLDERGNTLRFSHEHELGLPRFFVNDRRELLRRFQESYRSGWTTIVHPYIDVRRSFEINIGRDDWLLEHIPGMWESDNILPPDSLTCDHSGVVAANLFAFERTAKVASTGVWEFLESTPVKRAQAISWAKRIVEISRTLRCDLGEWVPMNVHFVEDKDSRWHFLNVRPGFQVLHQDRFPESLHIHTANSVKTLHEWDGSALLVFRLTSTRGNEKSLLESIRWIRKRTKIVFVEFGLLSHPAILMREQGLRVLSSRLLSTPSGRASYDHFNFSVSQR